MATASGHTTAILASKVQGTPVYNPKGDKIGRVEDVVLDKQSDHIMFAALGFGGVLGVGEKYYPVPWALLDYDEDKGGYVAPLSEEKIKAAPAARLEDLTKDDAACASMRTKTFEYYGVPSTW